MRRHLNKAHPKELSVAGMWESDGIWPGTTEMAKTLVGKIVEIDYTDLVWNYKDEDGTRKKPKGRNGLKKKWLEKKRNYKADVIAYDVVGVEKCRGKDWDQLIDATSAPLT